MFSLLFAPQVSGGGIPLPLLGLGLNLDSMAVRAEYLHIFTDTKKTECDRRATIDEVTDTSIYYQERAGRIYHSKGGDSYVYPADDQEYSRQAIIHKALKAQLDNKNWIPDSNLPSLFVTDPKIGRLDLVGPKSILDIGCGQGTLAMELADDFPLALITGLDLVPSFPQVVPGNCNFFIDDVSQGLDYPVDSFDLVHIRDLACGIPHYKQLLEESIYALRNGGLLHVVEPVGIISPSNTLSPILKSLDELVKTLIGAVTGREDAAITLEHEVRSMRDVTAIHIQMVDIPLCKSPPNCPQKDAVTAQDAALYRSIFLLQLSSLRLALTEHLEWTTSHLDSFEADLKAELRRMDGLDSNGCDAVYRWIALFCMKRS